MKKILLIRPPEKYLPHRARPMCYLPVGLLQIAAVLRAQGHAVELIDGIMPEGEPKEGENFFGITFEEMRARIEAVDFDIVGISAQFTLQWENASRMAALCKHRNPSCTVIVGGAHASVAYEDILNENGAVDYVVRGEGEYVTGALVSALRAGEPVDRIPGVAARTSSGVRATVPEPIMDLDRLPLPAYDLFDMEKYFELNKRYFTRTGYTFEGWERGVTVITSRGCPFGCMFCSIHLHMGRRWRAHSSRYVLEHIGHLIRRYGVAYLHFEDDNVTFDSGRFEEILDGMIDARMPVRWDTPNGVRADTLNEKLLLKCKRSGCTHLILGIESGVQRVIDVVIKKRIRLTYIEEVMAFAKKTGVDVKAFYMIGLPGETKDDIRATIRFILRAMWKYECFGGIAMAVPLLGTELYELCRRHRYFSAEPTVRTWSLGFHTSGLITTPEFDPPFLQTMIRYCSSRAKMIKAFVVARKLLRSPRLAVYLAHEMMSSPVSRWSAAYNKVAHFEHALTFDLSKGAARRT